MLAGRVASLAHQPPVPQDNLPKLDTNVNTQIRNIIGGLRIAHSLYLRLHVILDKSVHRHVFLEQLVRLVVRWTDGVVGVRRLTGTARPGRFSFVERCCARAHVALH